MSTSSYKIWLHERLRKPDLAANYLKTHLDGLTAPDGKQLLALALRDIAEANGVQCQTTQKESQEMLMPDSAQHAYLAPPGFWAQVWGRDELDDGLMRGAAAMLKRHAAGNKREGRKR